MSDYSQAREWMVRKQILARGIRDPRVVEAMRTFPPEDFLPAAQLAEFAYADHPLPIASGQTISQPYIVALITASFELKPGDKVLEIGTGSGLGRVAGSVCTVERHGDLAEAAQERLRSHSGDEYDASAITHVMACNSWFPGELISDLTVVEPS